MKTWQKLKENPKLWDRYFVREKVLTAIRRFFLDQDFHEVETPYLVGTLPPESYLDVFETRWYFGQNKDVRAFLPTSPEPFLKKLLAAGMGNCFSIPKSFRNTEDVSLNHSPEFSILEWYRIKADYKDIMEDCEQLLVFINAYIKRTSKSGEQKILPTELIYQGKRVDLSSPWDRLSMKEAFVKYAGFDLDRALDETGIKKIAAEKGYKTKDDDDWEELFHQIFLNEIEPKLGRGKPTILYDYPVQLAALSKKKKSDSRYAERFEFYIEGLELGDAYSELTDWKEQLARFENESKYRKELGKTDHPIDMDFIDALKYGMPECGGIAIGVDRLIMLFSDVFDIADTMFFPPKDLFDL